MRGILTFGLAALCAVPAFAASDDFNRAELGKKWNAVNGTLSISNNQLVGSNNALGTFKYSRTATTVSVVVSLNSLDTHYGAVAIGDMATGNNAFVKIQNPAGGDLFDRGAFYDANNHNNGTLFPLSPQVPSPATLTASLCGTVVTMTIKSSVGTQKYAHDYGSEAKSFGSGTGLGTFGPVTLDNYMSKVGRKCALDADTVMIGRPSLADPTTAK